MVEVQLGSEHGVSEDGVWEIGRIVSVTDNGKSVGVGVEGATIDVAVGRVRPLGGGEKGGDVPVEFNGARAWVRR